MNSFTISLCVLLVTAALSSPLPKAQEDGVQQDILHDFLIQQAFSPEKEHSAVYDAHDVLRFGEGADGETHQESVFLPQEYQVEAGVAVAEEPEQPEPAPLHGRLLSRGRNSNRRFPNRQNRIPPAEEHVVLEEEALPPQEEEIPVDAEPQQPKRRPGSRFPLRSRPNPLARGRNRSRPSKKPVTQATTPPPPETEEPVVEEVIQDEEYHYPDYEEEREPPTTTAKPRGILARRRNLSRNTNALFEALRKRRTQYAKTTTTTTPRPPPRNNYEKEVPTAAEDSKATGKKSVPSRRFGGSRRRFTPRGRKPAPQIEPEVNEEVIDGPVEEQQRSHRPFRTGYHARQ